MTPEERIAELEARVEKLTLLAGLPKKRKRKNRDQEIRMQFRKQLLFGGRK